MSNDVFSYLKTRSERGEPDLERSYVQGLETFARRYRRYPYLFRPLEALNARTGRPVDILFMGVRFAELILAVNIKYKVSVVVQGQGDLLWCLRHRLSFLLAWEWRAELLQAYRSQRGMDEKVDGVVSSIAATLQGLNPRALVLENDSLFLERAFVRAARAAAVTSFTIQDGLFMNMAPAHVMHGHSTDYMLVWGDFFKHLYVDKGILPLERVEVLGYPHSLPERRSSTKKQNPTVCLLGQPFETYDETLRKPRYEMIEHVATACEAVGLVLVYRPHPAENRAAVKREFPTLAMTNPSESLQQTIHDKAIFFSLNSTALVEAALQGKVAVQVLHKRFVADDFEKLGVCKSIEDDALVMEAFLREQKADLHAFSVDPAYIDTSRPPGERFCELLEALAPKTSPSRAEASKS
ncbi:hypothetical protein BH24DEI2_BH24DEI2_04040 [soil metagenome]